MRRLFRVSPPCVAHSSTASRPLRPRRFHSACAPVDGFARCTTASTPLTLPYVRDPATASAAVAADANPSAGSSGLAFIDAPPTIGLACDLCMAPQTTTSAGGVAPAPAVKPRAPFLKIPNAAVAKKGKVSGGKNKASDGSSRRPKKKLVGSAKDAAIEAPTSSLVASAADAHKVVDEMPPR
ncbi:hypothetical protein D1007_26857 [Hordeum vulgare]|nr:hypothetical protein D1007_58471 [Hordeum vulgare]KAE8797954.1 hypothetical protein D1007_26857 [Hordeum vulgare]